MTSGLPPGFILGLILFNILINDMDGGTEHALSSFAGDAKLRGLVERPDVCSAVQRDLNMPANGPMGTS